jgi:teichuronic acid biosynthesis glycosyltransferase TuaC
VRILSFSYCFPRPRAPAWGVFVYQRLAAMARRVPLEVVSPVPSFPVLSRFKGPRAPLCSRWQDVTVHRPRFFYLPGIFKSLDARFYAAGIRRWLAQFADRWQPDLLDAHFVWPDGVGVSLLAKEFGLPYSITLRGKIYPCLEVASQRRQCAEALRSAAAVVSVDHRMADIAQELGAEPARVHVIPNGVDLNRFQPGDRAAARQELGLPPGGRLLVSVGHLGERKGHRETLSALARLPRDVRLVLVGGDSKAHRGGKQDLEQLAESLGLDDRVIFAGPQPFDRIPLYYQAADASVLASWREGCPNVVLESLACGTPVVAADVGSVPMMIEDGRNGRIVPPCDADQLAKALGEVLDMHLPAEQVRGSPAVRSWDDVAAEVCTVFQAAVGRSVSNPPVAQFSRTVVEHP